MSDLTRYPLEDNYETSLTQALTDSTGDLTIYVATTPTFTFPSGVTLYMKINAGKSNEETVEVESYDSGASTLTVKTGGRGAALGASVSGTAQAHAVGSKIIISDDYANWAEIALRISEKMDKTGGTFTGAVDFTSDDETVTFQIPNMTETKRDLIASPDNGMIIYNTTAGTAQQYDGGVWYDIPNDGSVPNASETVAGIVELATNAEMGAGTSVGATGARLLPPNDQLVKTSSGAGDENKIAVLDATGKFATGFVDGLQASAGSADADKVIGTDANGVLDPSITAISMVAGEAITAGQAVYSKASDGEVYLLDSSAIGEAVEAFVGFAMISAGDGEQITVNPYYSNNQTGLTVGSYYYATDTPGTISTTPGTVEKLVGLAISATELLVIKSDYIAAGTLTNVPFDSTTVQTTVLGFRPKILVFTCEIGCYSNDTASTPDGQSYYKVVTMHITDSFTTGTLITIAHAKDTMSSVTTSVSSATTASITMSTLTSSTITTSAIKGYTQLANIAVALTDTGFTMTPNTTRSGSGDNSDGYIQDMRYIAYR